MSLPKKANKIVVNQWRCHRCGTRLRAHLDGTVGSGDILDLNEPLYVVVTCLVCEVGKNSRWKIKVDAHQRFAVKKWKELKT